jgi:hypothetical protein
MPAAELTSAFHFHGSSVILLSVLGNYTAARTMIDPETEDVFPLSDGPKKVGRSADSLRIYINRGVERDDGEVVYLELFNLPGGAATSLQAWYRFLRAINGQRA